MNRESLPLSGLRVAAFENRMGPELARLLERTGAEPHVSPALREVPLIDNPDAVDFANRLISGQVDIVILMTGVGTKHLVAQIERHIDRQRFLNCLTDIVTVARGPKPVAALREFSITRPSASCTTAVSLGKMNSGVSGRAIAPRCQVRP